MCILFGIIHYVRFAKFSEKLTFLTPSYAHVCVVYQGVRNASFSENFTNVLNESFLSFYIDHEITLKMLEFVLNSIEKIKPGILLSSMCIFSDSNGTKS